MACRLSEIVIGCRDPEALAQFWCGVLGHVVLDREGDVLVEIGPAGGFGGAEPTLLFLREEERTPGRSRVHVDVNPTDRDQDAELERLLALGACHADVGQPADASWYVLADPEDNEFCLLRSRLDPLPPTRP